MTYLGGQVRVRRESKGWTRTELARRAGLVSDTHVRLIEDGRRADPQASTVVKLAKALGCTPDALLLPSYAPPPIHSYPDGFPETVVTTTPVGPDMVWFDQGFSPQRTPTALNEALKRQPPSEPVEER